MITLSDPIWLALAVPLALLMYLFPPRSALQGALRALAYIFIVTAASGLHIRHQQQAGTTILIADRSLSMPQGAQAAQLEAYNQLAQEMGAADALGAVTFGADNAVERVPGSSALQTFSVEVDSSASNLGRALRKALALVPPGEPGAILIVSDGIATDTSALAEASIAAGRSIRIDYRRFARPPSGDISIERIDAPLDVDPLDSFMLNTYVHADEQSQATYTLTRDSIIIAQGETTLRPGRNRLTFRDRATTQGTLDYQFNITPVSQDPVHENNTARHLVGVRSSRPILLVSQTPAGGLAQALQAHGINANVASPQQVDWSLESLAGYTGVILENIAIQDIGYQGAVNIAALVEHQGLGLMMTGGRRSFASGGWHESPLDPILPVSMDLRQEFRQLAASIVVVMDRSGSMGMMVPGGKTKMDLAGIASASVLGMLTPIDQFGAIAVDQQPHTIISLQPAEQAKQSIDKLRRLQAGGGGIFVYNGLRAGARELLKVNAGNRHIILFSDAQDTEQPGDYKNFMRTLSNAGVTVSVVGLGTNRDVDAPLLKDIATLGKGRIFFTQDARLLPQIFAQDALAVTRGAFHDTQTPIQTTGLLNAMTGLDFSTLPDAGGYNPLQLRERASVAAYTQDEHNAPFIAYWNSGTGRVLTYAGEVDGDATGPIGSWSEAGGFFASMARWLNASRSEMPNTMLAQQHIEGGVLRVDLDVAPEGRNTLQAPQLFVLRRQGEAEPLREIIPLAYTDPNRLSAEVTLSADEVIATAIKVNDELIVPLAPVTLPYAPEFRPSSNEVGTQLLARLAQLTGGTERSDLAGIWDDMPLAVRTRNLALWLYLGACLLLLLEVAQRRTAALTQAARAVHSAKPIAAAAHAISRMRTPAPTTSKTSTKPITKASQATQLATKQQAGKTPKPKPDPSTQAAAAKPNEKPPAQSNDLLSALDDIRKGNNNSS